MDDHVLQQVFGLLHEFRIQADVPRPVVATAPLGLHALEEITGHLDAQPRFPLLNKFG